MRRRSNFAPPIAPVGSNTPTPADSNTTPTPSVNNLSAIIPPVELPLQIREVLGFKARLLTGLPLATTLLCAQAHEGGRLILATHGAAPAAGNGFERAPAFVGPELDALVAAAEQGRGTWVAVATWCARKDEDPAWRLTRIEALGGVYVPTPSLGWTTSQVLRVLGLELVEVLT